MKTNYIKLQRLMPWLGAVLIAVGVMAAGTYFQIERKTHSADACNATLDRLNQEHQLSSVLKKLHNGDVAEAAHYLDLLLCGDVLLTNAELASADAQTRALVQNSFRRIAMARLRTEGPTAPPTGTHVNDQIAAERILTLALATGQRTEKN